MAEVLKQNNMAKGKMKGPAFKLRSTNKTSFKNMGSSAKDSPTKFGTASMSHVTDPYRGMDVSEGFRQSQQHMSSGKYYQENPWMREVAKRGKGESRRDYARRFKAHEDRVANLSDEDFKTMSDAYSHRGGFSTKAIDARKQAQSDFWSGLDARDAEAAKTKEDEQYAKFKERFQTETAAQKPADKPLTGIDKLKANRPDFMKPNQPGTMTGPQQNPMMPQPQQTGGYRNFHSMGKGGQAPTGGGPSKGMQRPTPRPMGPQPSPSRGGSKGGQGGGKGGQMPTPSYSPPRPSAPGLDRPNPNIGIGTTNQMAAQTPDMPMQTVDPVTTSMATKKAPYKMKRGVRPSFKDLGSSKMKKK